MAIEARHQAEISRIDFEIDMLEVERKKAVEPILTNLSRVTKILDENIGSVAIPGDAINGQIDKDAGQVRMDVVLAVSLYSQLRFDAEIVQFDEDDYRTDLIFPETQEGESSIFGFEPHTIISQAMELLYEKSKLLNPEDRTTLSERTNRKLRMKHEEVFSKGRDFTHLIEDFYKYEDGPKGEFRDADNPIEILDSIRDFESTDWNSVVYNLRAVALANNRNILEDIIRASEESNGS